MERVMRVTRWIAIALAALAAAWMVFDGLRALIIGDYVTPSTGPYAGQLGPWASLVSGVGIDPRGIGMKWFCVLYGFGWLWIVIAYVRNKSWAWWGMVAFAAGSLWYLVVGTVSAVLQLTLLFLIRRRTNVIGRLAGSYPT
jgi:hypothetical protein